MKFHIITIFPEIIRNYFEEGVIGRAVKDGLLDVELYNLRDYTSDKHGKVDDTPYGGGPGMVLRVDVICNCIENIKDSIKKEKGEKELEKTKTILFSAKGKKYNQKKACLWRKELKHIILICGRYEGVDERIAKFVADEEISIGEYVLSGGELPALVVTDSVARLIPGVLGNEDSLSVESYSGDDLKERDYPVYTKPEVFNKWRVPKVLLSGNHQEIEKWRKKKC
ncbi:MAG: tRNA (guanosine(37)-N1)-methyltransferase TrmD [Candidatus Moraniibacteriota bacterium]